MKKAAQILLIIFITFLVTPTVICAIKKGADISCSYNFSEEEQSKKEVKLVYNFQPIFYWVSPPQALSTPILTKNLLKFDEISLGIFIPPPELM